MDIIIIAILASCALFAYIEYSRRTKARHKAFDIKASRDEIIAMRKRMKINPDNLSEEDKAILLTTKRDKWFTIFLYFMIAIIGYLIINNLVLINRYYGTNNLTDSVRTAMFLKIILYGIEIFIYVLLLFKLKRKIVYFYFVLIIFSGFISIFMIDFMSSTAIFRLVFICLAFQSQWHHFEY